MICRSNFQKLLAVTVTATLLSAAGSALAQPANDNCADAPVVTAGSYPFDTTLATNDSNVGACAAATASPDIWFRYTSPTTGAATFSLCGSSYDTALSILDACGGVELACNDDFCGLSSQLTSAVTAGTPVWIRVAGFVGQVGTGTLTITDPVMGGGIENDNCADATPVGEGSFPYTTVGATNDGTGSCAASGTSPDIWFDYLAPVDGLITFTTCDPARAYDTAMSIFDSCGGSELGCNDDGPPFCANPGVGFSGSTINLTVVTGTHYFVRVAGFAGAVGSSVLHISGAAAPPANDNCAAAELITADNFTFSNQGATTDGSNTCGFGGDPGGSDIWYIYNPASTATYAFETCGSGFDTIVGIFDSCGGSELACNDDACGLQSRAQLALTMNVPVVVRISGFAGEQGNGTMNIITVVPPANDSCATAAVAVLGDNAFDNTFADTDGSASCGFGGDPGGHDVWFSFTATQTGIMTLTTCPDPLDTIVSVLDSCGGSELACNDDSAGLCSTVSAGVTNGAVYIIRLAGFANVAGSGTLNISIADFPVACLAQPPGSTLETETCGEDLNGGCNDPATSVQSVSANETVFGTAWADNNVRDTDWFEFTIAGPSEVTVSLQSEFVGRVFLLSSACPPAILATAVSESCGAAVSVSGTLAAGTYRAFAGHNSFAGTPCVLEGRTHYILTITSAAVGACCTPGGCLFTTAAGCSGAGGTFQGGGTDCGTTSYVSAASTEVLEDISATGTASIAGDCDDCGETVAIGFDFSFFSALFTDVSINSNGFLSFGGPSGDFTNDCPIPSAVAPNNIIAPAWDDWYPIGLGDVHYEVRGTAPDRRFIAQWTGIEQFFAVGDSNTFQVILYEGSNNIEFRYGTMTEQVACDITVGVENTDGTAGLNLDATVVIGAGNSAVLLTSSTSSSDCDGGPCAAADFNGDGFINPDDLSDFITCFFLDVLVPGSCPLADFNGDGFRDPDDLSDFITTFFLAVAAGC